VAGEDLLSARCIAQEGIGFRENNPAVRPPTNARHPKHTAGRKSHNSCRTILKIELS
jgi:hypothetical protein